MSRNFYFLLAALAFTADIKLAQAQPVKGVWQLADSLELIDGAKFAAASDKVAYYIAPDKGWKTLDGGHSWTPLIFPEQITIGPHTIVTQGEDSILLLQQRFDTPAPMVVRSNDGGASWQIVKDSNLYDNIKSVTMCSPQIIHMIALDASGNGKSYVSNDGGATFAEGRSDSILAKYIATSLSGTKRYAISVAWSDSLNGVVSLSPKNIPNPTAHVLITHDAGTTWKEMFLPDRNDTIPIPGEVYAKAGTPYFWVNVTDLALPGCYYLSTDQGESWRVSTAVGRPLEQLAPVDTALVWGLFSAFQYNELNRNKIYVQDGLAGAWSQTSGIPSGGGNSRSITYFKFFGPSQGWACGTRINATGTLYYYIYRLAPLSSVSLAASPGELFVSPIPVVSVLHIHHAQTIRRLEIVDIAGRNVTSLTSEMRNEGDERSLNVGSLSSGVYTILGYTDNEVRRASFIKE